MKTVQIIETIRTQGSLEVPRFKPEAYVLRKQCKRLVDTGLLACAKQDKTFKYELK